MQATAANANEKPLARSAEAYYRISDQAFSRVILGLLPVRASS